MRPPRHFWPAGQALCALLILIAGTPAQAQRIAVFRIDPLGVEPEIVARLDGLFRMELGRLLDHALPSPVEVARLIERNVKLKNCTGGVGCLVLAGRALKVDQVISGNVGGLAGSYVLNLKMVGVEQAKETRRIQETISGKPDQLIEAVRVAAYRLIAPARLRGTLEVLANVGGAKVYLDGVLLGQTPLAPRHGLAVGEHTVRVSKDGYTDVVQPAKVRLQKTARVVVTLQAPAKGPVRRAAQRATVNPWYTRWWFWSAVGVAAVGIGVALGLASAPSPVVDCGVDPGRCGMK